MGDMSRDIDMSDPSSWSADDVEYLDQRGRLPRDFDRNSIQAEAPEPTPLEELESTGDVGDDMDFSTEDDAVMDEDDDLESMTLEQLRERAEELGVAKSGTKAELIKRIREAS